MALWMVRAGKHGEYEKRFLDEGKVYLTWDGLNHNLAKVADKAAMRELLSQVYPDRGKGWVSNNLGQIWGFSRRIEVGDWIVLPSKLKRSAIHIGKVTSRYKYDAKAKDPFYHSMGLEWFAQDIPRSNFDQDLLYSFGAFMTVCRIQRNDAEKRVKAMAANGWKSTPIGVEIVPSGDGDDGPEPVAADLEEIARDQIAKLIIAKYKGHGMARLVNAILEAQGYTTHLSPEGPDKGVDILAGTGPMGFGELRICVQVKSGDSPIDRPTLDQLIGTMQNVQASQGLLVSWGGFMNTVDKERATQFFRVRLWDQNDLIEQLLNNYEKLDDDLRAELPLKRIWTVATQDQQE